MAVIFEEALKKDLAKKNLLPVYLLFGEDAYLKSLYLNKISQNIADADDVFNYCKFSGQFDLQSVYDAVVQLPLMNDKKCIILNDFDFEGCAKSDFDRLLELLGEIPESSVVIFYFDAVIADPKKSAKFKKLISAAEKAGGAAVQLNHRTKAELVKMLSTGAQKRGCRLDSSVAEYLIETAGDDINLLSLELTKLCAFVKEGCITKNHIDEVCTKTIEADIFRLSDCIMSCNSTAALKMVDDLFFTRLEPAIILYQIASPYVDMYRLYSANQQGLKKADVVSAYGYGKKAFLLDKASRNLQKFNYKKLNLSLTALTDADRALKTFGMEGRTVIEELIVKLIYIIAKGESLD